MESLIVGLSSLFCLTLVLSLFSFFNRLWWTPRRIQKLMGSQGIRGPPYQFFYGNNKDVISMKMDATSSPMELSHYILPRVQPHFYSWTKLYGKNFLTWYGHQPQLVITEPDLIKEILNNKEGSFAKTKVEGNVKRLFGYGLVTSQGQKWFKLRKLANHTFHGESLKGMMPAMIERVDAMLERWGHQDGKEIEVFHELRVLISQVISRTAFGSSEGHNIFDMFVKMSGIISRTNYKIPLLRKFTSDEAEANKLEQGIRESIIKMIKNREEKVKMGLLDNYGNDFLGSLLQIHNDSDNNKKISLDDIIDECKTFYLAGHGTTSSLLGWTILLLAIDGDWQDKVRQEVLELFGKQIPSPDNIGKLKIMGIVVNEALRLYPPVVVIARRTERETRLGKMILPADMEVHMPTLTLHHNPDIWGEDCHFFKPERFSEGVARATNNNTGAYFPFGLGPRTCVGSNFAISEAKIALSMILQRYKFNLSPNYVHSPAPTQIIRPQHGLQIMVQSL